MSRTDKTMPERIQYEDLPDWRLNMIRYCHPSGASKYSRFAERSARQKTRLALARGEEPEPTRHRHDMCWRLY